MRRWQSAQADQADNKGWRVEGAAGRAWKNSCDCLDPTQPTHVTDKIDDVTNQALPT